MLRLGIPLVAGLSAAHGLVPPHPGPLAAIERLGADTGRTLFYSLIVEPARRARRRVRSSAGWSADGTGDGPWRNGRSVHRSERGRLGLPSLATTLLTILMPVLLMLLAALAQATMADGMVRQWMAFAGSPLVAMLLATLLAMYTFGQRVRVRPRRGCCSSREESLRQSQASSSSSAPGAASAACS